MLEHKTHQIGTKKGLKQISKHISEDPIKLEWRPALNVIQHV